MILSAIPLRAWLALGLFAALAGSHWYAYQQGKNAADEKHKTEMASMVVQQMRRFQQLETEAELARAELLAWQTRREEEVRDSTNDAKERIRTIYRDRPVPVGCERPAGVRDELQRAIARANAAARGM